VNQVVRNLSGSVPHAFPGDPIITGNQFILQKPFSDEQLNKNSKCIAKLRIHITGDDEIK
jgi:hypothetical protein